ncbi:MAG: hypothetical protein WCH37_06165 [Synechococcaceae cyanobacterium ELA182]
MAIEAVGNMPGAVLLGTLATLGLAMAVFSLLPLSPAQKGALVLASSFGLVPALGLQAAKVAVLCEVTTTPLNLSVGLSTGSRYAAAAASAPPVAEGDFADRAALAR